MNIKSFVIWASILVTQLSYANCEGFSFTNCGPTDDPIQIKSLSLLPDPLIFPGTITSDGEISMGKNITGPLTVSLKMIKIIGKFKFEVPCIDGIGSCTYDDVCSRLPKNNEDCPDVFKQQGIPCSCPFPQGIYKTTGLSLDVELKVKPPKGEYQIIANIQNDDLGHVGCLNIKINLE